MDTKKQAREWLQSHFPLGNHGFWNWQDVDSLAAAIEQAVLDEAEWWIRYGSDREGVGHLRLATLRAKAAERK